MDGPDLSFINIDINLDKVKPLGTKKIIAFVNCFLIRNVQMLNRFVCDMERRIVDMENRMSRVEVDLKLLELKLDSIASLQKVHPNKNEPSEKFGGAPLINSSAGKNILMEKGVDSQNVHIVDVPVVPVSTGSERPLESRPFIETTAVINTHLRIRDDPRYEKYFKMLKMGVVEGAVKLKMASEGFNPSLLDTPDAPSDLPEGRMVAAEDKGSTSTGDEDLSSSFSDT